MPPAEPTSNRSAAASDPAPAPGRPPLRIGVVGAGSTRQGLGPYLVSAIEAAGACVAAVAGRDLPSAERTAQQVAVRLGRPVAAHASAAQLARAVDALVVASPVHSHREGLAAALAAGIPCLCEKPLVGAGEMEAGLALLAGFRQAGLLVEENCQWPFVLPALYELYPALTGQPVRTVAMGLGPAFRGRAMVEDSLSHVLSVVQALAAVDGARGVQHVRQTDPGPAAERNLVAFELQGAGGPVAVELHLTVCPTQPRPAWLAVNGLRMDRRIGPGYSLSFVATDGREVSAPDPMRQLVYRFCSSLQVPHRDRTNALADSLVHRLLCYASLLGALGTAG